MLRTMQTFVRNEAGHLAEENQLLRQSISELREEDLKEKQQELL